jgi:ribosome-interacting GTPase 1
VLIREDVTVDRFIDSMDPSCIYVPMLVVLNKIDLADKEYLEKLKLEMPEAILIAADKGINTEELKDEIFERLELIRLYLKPQGKKADLEEPMIIRKGSTIADVAAKLHRDFIKNFRHAKVWGTSVKFPGQKVGLDHILKDKDILRLIIRK